MIPDFTRRELFGNLAALLGAFLGGRASLGRSEIAAPTAGAASGPATSLSYSLTTLPPVGEITGFAYDPADWPSEAVAITTFTYYADERRNQQPG